MLCMIVDDGVTGMVRLKEVLSLVKVAGRFTLGFLRYVIINRIERGDSVVGP